MRKFEAEREITRILQQLEEATGETVEEIVIEETLRQEIQDASPIKLRTVRVVTSLKRRWS